jgi:Leucine-rich repeat (LRR) protein
MNQKCWLVLSAIFAVTMIVAIAILGLVLRNAHLSPTREVGTATVLTPTVGPRLSAQLPTPELTSSSVETAKPGMDCQFFDNLKDALAHPEYVCSLDLEGKDLQQLPPEMAAMTNLVSLSLKHNHLMDLPIWIERFKNLETLDASDNDLRELPAEIGNLANLTALVLDSNKRTDDVTG